MLMQKKYSKGSISPTHLHKEKNAHGAKSLAESISPIKLLQTLRLNTTKIIAQPLYFMLYTVCLLSISSTFYVQIFHTNVVSAAFL